MRDWQKAILLVLIVACAVLAHVGAMYAIDALGWNRVTFYPFSALIYLVIAFAVKGIHAS